MGGLAIETCDDHRYRLDLSGIQRAVERGVMELPPIDDNEIKERSKADWFTKSLACLQTTWFGVQLIGRAGQGLLMANIERLTLAMVLCSIATYAVWWSKPLDVQIPYRVRYPRDYKTLRSVLQLDELEARSGGNGQRVSLRDYDEAEPTYSPFSFYGPSTLITLVFGCCHLAGWNAHFSSPVEQWLWRGSALACTVLPFMMLLLAFLNLSYPWNRACAGIYTLARLSLLVLAFVGLRSVPQEVYTQVRWASYIPHF